eukprot:Nk52_evm61s621 gene=Nk52_evmTU61s621
MSDARVQRLSASNAKLQEELNLPRIKVSEAAALLIEACESTPDYMCPFWQSRDNGALVKSNPFNQKKGMCNTL